MRIRPPAGRVRIRPPAGRDRASIRPAVLRHRDVWGTVAVLIAAFALFWAFAASGLGARARARVPMDDSASSKGFLSWAFAEVSREAGTDQLVGVKLSTGELDLTLRKGAVEQRWKAYPQDLPRLASSGPITPTSGVVRSLGDQAADLAMVWSDYEADVATCPSADLSVVGAASWGTTMHFTASCRSGGALPREWIGASPVELQGTLSTRYSLSVIVSDLGKLSPHEVSSLELTMGGVDALGCRATVTWPHDAAGGTQWIAQSRLCYTQEGDSYLPVGVVAPPAQATVQRAHPLDLSRIDVSALEALSSESGLPSNQTDITGATIAWSDRFAQQVIEVRSGANSPAHIGWYTLTGQLLALDQS